MATTRGIPIWSMKCSAPTMAMPRSVCLSHYILDRYLYVWPPADVVLCMCKRALTS
jgi:hypothetical protein